MEDIMKKIVWVDCRQKEPRIAKIKQTLQKIFKEDYSHYKGMPFGEIYDDQQNLKPGVNQEIKLFVLHWGNQEVPGFVHDYSKRCEECIPIILYSGGSKDEIEQANKKLQSVKIIPVDMFLYNIDTAMKKVKKALKNNSSIDIIWFWEKEPPTSQLLSFSLLKHGIAQLFLPIAIDLQGISEVLLEQKDKEKARKYFEECFGKSGRNNKRKRFSIFLKELPKIVNSSELEKDYKNKVLEEIKNFLPKQNPYINYLKDSIEKGFDDLTDYLLDVRDKNGKSFHDWFSDILKILDKLSENLQKSKTGRLNE